MVSGRSGGDGTKRQQVVVAEDDYITRLLLVSWLEVAGYEVICTDNGRDAFAEVMRNRASVLVTDWNMPEMNGLELCQHLRAGEYRPYPYIIMVTARDCPQDVEAAIEAGADDYLVKPIQHDDLVTRIKQAHSVLRRLQGYVEKMETDDLTGLLNRRRFEECFSVEIQQACREGHPLSCFLIDLDWFKHINDRWGHGVGDRALKEVACTMKRVTSGVGYVCRFGGDEFCLLLPEVGESEASAIGEHLRREIESIRLDVDEKQSVALSATLGVSVLREGVSSSRELIDAADEALMAAKRSGRNCVVTYGQLSNHQCMDQFSANEHRTRLSNVTAGDVMTSPIVTLSETNTLREAGDLFLRLRITSVPVVNGHSKLVGVISENDVLAAVATKRGWDTMIAKVMQRNVMCYDGATKLHVIWETLDRISVRRVVIVDDKVPVGVISRGTLLRWMGNWGESFSRKRGPINEREKMLREHIQRVAPTVMHELQELHDHAAANNDCVVAATLNTVTRIQEQVGDLLAFCQVDHQFEPERASVTGRQSPSALCDGTPRVPYGNDQLHEARR